MAIGLRAWSTDAQRQRSAGFIFLDLLTIDILEVSGSRRLHIRFNEHRLSHAMKLDGESREAEKLMKLRPAGRQGDSCAWGSVRTVALLEASERELA